VIALTPNSADIAAIRANVERSIAAFESGNTAEGIQAAAQATAVTMVSSLAFVWASSTRFPVKGLDLVFNSLTKSPPLWGQILQQAGIITDPLMASKFGNFMASITAGASAGYLTNSAIDWINEQNLGSQFYDYLHPDQVPDSTASLFTTATLVPAPRRDPLVLDLDGDGIPITAAVQSLSTKSRRWWSGGRHVIGGAVNEDDWKMAAKPSNVPSGLKQVLGM
jgi:hypothetical protein